MLTVTIAARDFAEIVYPAVAGDTPDTVGKLKLVIGLMTKLEADTTVSEFQADGVSGTVRTYLDGVDSLEFELEDAEAEYLHERLVTILPQLAVARSRHLLPILSALKE